MNTKTRKIMTIRAIRATIPMLLKSLYLPTRTSLQGILEQQYDHYHQDEQEAATRLLRLAHAEDRPQHLAALDNYTGLWIATTSSSYLSHCSFAHYEEQSLAVRVALRRALRFTGAYDALRANSLSMRSLSKPTIQALPILITGTPV